MLRQEHNSFHIVTNYTIRQKLNFIPEHTKNNLELYSSTKYGNSRDGKPDNSWFALRIQGGHDIWPTLIMEVGYSQSEVNLKRDAMWWLTTSGGQTQFVIIVKVKRNMY